RLRPQRVRTQGRMVVAPRRPVVALVLQVRMRAFCCSWRSAWQLAALNDPAHADAVLKSNQPAPITLMPHLDDVRCGDKRKEDYPVADDHDRGECDRDNNP